MLLEEITFDEVLCTQSYKDLFYSFLQKNQNTEMCDFMEDVEKKVDFSILQNMYIQYGSEKELNIPQELRNKVLKYSTSHLTELYNFIRLQLKLSCFGNFQKTAHYKTIILQKYSQQRSAILEELAMKDVTEWNWMEVFVFLTWHDMAYMLEAQELLGRMERPNGVKLFMLIEEDELMHKHVVNVTHLEILQDLMKSPSARDRVIHFSVSHGRRLVNVPIKFKTLMKNEEDCVNMLTRNVARSLKIDMAKYNVKLQMKDKDGDPIVISKAFDLKYILNQQNNSDHHSVTCIAKRKSN